MTLENDSRGPESLREPMNLGEIIDATIDLFKKNIKDYTVTSLIVAAPALILMVLLSAINLASPEDQESLLAFVFMAFSFIISFVIVIFYMNALIKLSSDYYNGLKPTFKDALKYSLEKFWKMGFAILALSFILILLFSFTALFFAGVMALTSNKILAAVATLIPLGFTIYYTFCIFLFPYVIVIEDLGIMDALKRSMELFRSSRNASMKIILVPYLINALTLVCTFVPILGSLLVFLSYPLPIIAMTLVYYDIRIRYEGYDLMIQAEKLNSGI